MTQIENAITKLSNLLTNLSIPPAQAAALTEIPTSTGLQLLAVKREEMITTVKKLKFWSRKKKRNIHVIEIRKLVQKFVSYNVLVLAAFLYVFLHGNGYIGKLQGPAPRRIT